MRDGYEAPFVRIYAGDLELTDSVEDFKYHYDEEDDDVCNLTIRTKDRDAPDQKYFQEKQELKIIWGYIGGVISNVRKIFIQELKWEFESDTVKIAITATEKAVSLKFTDNNAVYKNTNLAGVVNQISNNHGVKAFWEVTEDDLKNSKNPKFLYDKYVAVAGETTDQYLIRQRKQKDKENYDYQVSHPKEAKIELNKVFDALATRNNNPEFKMTQQRKKLFKDGYAGAIIGGNRDGAPISGGKQFQYPTDAFKPYSNLPQANRSDKQFIRNIAAREPGGPFILDSRDDSITIKKRNFNQKPYKTYKYGSVTGDILSFTPESKNRSKQASSSNVGFGGWNAGNKSYFSGYSNASNDQPNATLASKKELLIYYKGISKLGGGGTVVDYQKRPGFRSIKTLGNFKTDKTNTPITDNTRAFLNTPNRPVPISVDDKIAALAKTLKDFSNDSNDEGKNIYSPGNDASGALANAANRRRQAELDKTKATLKVEGDPKLEVGMIVTIIGVSKKYSGNYYITKADHDFGQGNGYITDLELVRDGNNLKVNEAFVPTEKLGATLNSDVGPENSPTSNTKKLKTKTNPK